MNVLKNMEAIFIVAVALALSASAFAAPAQMHAGDGKLVQVVVQGNPMSASQLTHQR